MNASRLLMIHVSNADKSDGGILISASIAVKLESNSRDYLKTNLLSFRVTEHRTVLFYNAHDSGAARA